MKHIVLWSTGVLLLLCGVSQEARGDAITFNFTGTVTQFNSDPSDPFGGTISFGTPITGSYTFESTSPDSDPGASSGSYQITGSPYGVTATMGGNTFTTSDFLAINIFDSSVDQYGALGCAPDASTCFSGDLSIALFLQDATGTALSSDGLPLLPPDLSDFQTRDFSLFQNYFDANGDFFQIEIGGQIDSLSCASCSVAAIPEPATVFLLGFGLAGLPFVRSRIVRNSKQFRARR